AQFLALKAGSSRTEIVFLNQDLPIRPASIVGGFHPHLLRSLAHRLFDLVNEPRNRLRPVEFHHDVLGGVGPRPDPARASRTEQSIKEIFNWVSGILG